VQQRVLAVLYHNGGEVRSRPKSKVNKGQSQPSQIIGKLMAVQAAEETTQSAIRDLAMDGLVVIEKPTPKARLVRRVAMTGKGEPDEWAIKELLGVAMGLIARREMGRGESQLGQKRGDRINVPTLPPAVEALTPAPMNPPLMEQQQRQVMAPAPMNPWTRWESGDPPQVSTPADDARGALAPEVEQDTGEAPRYDSDEAPVLTSSDTIDYRKLADHLLLAAVDVLNSPTGGADPEVEAKLITANHRAQAAEARVDELQRKLDLANTNTDTLIARIKEYEDQNDRFNEQVKTLKRQVRDLQAKQHEYPLKEHLDEKSRATLQRLIKP
jgi:hypothetical protein